MADADRDEEIERWIEAGLERWAVHGQAARLSEAGLHPEDVRIWRSAGYQPPALVRLLPYLGSDFGFDALMEVLGAWKGEGYAGPMPPGELLTYLEEGFDAQELRTLVAKGHAGHQIFRWRGVGVPPEKWNEWDSYRVEPSVAVKYFVRGVDPATVADYPKGRDPEIVDAFCMQFVDELAELHRRYGNAAVIFRGDGYNYYALASELADGRTLYALDDHLYGRPTSAAGWQVWTARRLPNGRTEHGPIKFAVNLRDALSRVHVKHTS